jgi:hypothetical protein
MTLLPPRTDSPTAFPTAHGPDLQQHIRQTEEMWRVSYPVVNYMSMLKAVTSVTDVNTLSGEAGTTQFDPMWGEAVPANMGATWKQPHANTDPAVHASDPALFSPAVPLHARIQRTAREDLLKKVGFDRIRSLLLTIPASMCDAVNINPKAGDRFTWDGELYHVLQYSPLGWWMNTNTKLYVVLNCAHEHRGS